MSQAILHLEVIYAYFLEKVKNCRRNLKVLFLNKGNDIRKKKLILDDRAFSIQIYNSSAIHYGAERRSIFQEDIKAVDSGYKER
jgi:hypothetical protein